MNVSHTCLQFEIYVFNSIVTRLSWHVLYYLISKNLYSLQNAQPFIFQLICMQLYKCINCFLKAQNKQLNQYCLKFTIFLPKKKKFKKKNGSGSSRVASWVGLTRKRHGSIHFCFGSKNQVWVKYFSDQVGSGQNILTRFAMSTRKHMNKNFSIHFCINVIKYQLQRSNKVIFKAQSSALILEVGPKFLMKPNIQSLALLRRTPLEVGPDSFLDLKLLTHNLRSQNSKESNGYYASETQTLRVLIKIKQRMAKGLARVSRTISEPNCFFKSTIL